MTTLPPVLAEIAAVAGMRAALTLARDMANRRVNIPHNPPADHWLVRLVGLDAALQICQRYGGNRLLIPPTLVGQARQRREAIWRMSRDGGSVMEIASAIGVARSTVQRTRKKRQPAPLPLLDE